MERILRAQEKAQKAEESRAKKAFIEKKIAQADGIAETRKQEILGKMEHAEQTKERLDREKEEE